MYFVCVFFFYKVKKLELFDITRLRVRLYKDAKILR